jgi:hypothetical protein
MRDRSDEWPVNQRFLHRENRQVGVGLQGIQRHPNPCIEIRLPHDERVVHAVPQLHLVPLVVARKMMASTTVIRSALDDQPSTISSLRLRSASSAQSPSVGSSSTQAGRLTSISLAGSMSRFTCRLTAASSLERSGLVEKRASSCGPWWHSCGRRSAMLLPGEYCRLCCHNQHGSLSKAGIFPRDRIASRPAVSGPQRA